MTESINDVSTHAFEPLLTVEDLERMLRINKRTVARLCKKGQLPEPLKIGGQNRWRMEDISETLDLLVSKRKGAQRREGELVTV
jgi:predicted DNA-binding transcriptional regulator AlpA